MQTTTTRRFKEHDVARPEWLADKDGWFDQSWHNDALPHVSMFLTANESDGPCVEFWVNYEHATDREVPPRYMAVFQRSWVVENGGDAVLYDGDDEAVAKQWARASRIAKTIIPEILAEPVLLACRTFSELHEHVDANVLGEQEQYLEECGWTGKDDAKDEAALIATTDVLNNAQAIVDAFLRTRR